LEQHVHVDEEAARDAIASLVSEREVAQNELREPECGDVAFVEALEMHPIDNARVGSGVRDFVEERSQPTKSTMDLGRHTGRAREAHERGLQDLNLDNVGSELVVPARYRHRDAGASELCGEIEPAAQRGKSRRPRNLPRRTRKRPWFRSKPTASASVARATSRIVRSMLCARRRPGTTTSSSARAAPALDDVFEILVDLATANESSTELMLEDQVQALTGDRAHAARVPGAWLYAAHAFAQQSGQSIGLDMPELVAMQRAMVRAALLIKWNDVVMSDGYPVPAIADHLEPRRAWVGASPGALRSSVCRCDVRYPLDAGVCPICGWSRDDERHGDW
jgi:hypothetical protein